MPHLRPRAAPALLACAAAALAAGTARADGLGAYLEPGYTHSDTESVDQTGRRTTTTADEFSQRYRLFYDRAFAPTLRFRGLALLDKTLDWATSDGASSRADSLRTSGSAHLLVGPTVLNAELGYDRTEESAGSSLSPQRSDLVNEIYTVRTSWHPADLPTFDLRLSRTQLYDPARVIEDVVTNEALLSSSYDVYRELNVAYTMHWLNPNDRLAGTDSDTLLNTAAVRYADTFNDKRTSLAVNYTFLNRLTTTSVTGSGNALVTTQQVPVHGLSLVESFPPQPDNDHLDVNDALSNGRTDDRTSLDLGTAPARAGKTDAIELGAQFTDPATRINTLYLWVDRRLTPQVAASFAGAFTAYRSDDGLRWTAVAVTAPVIFDEFQNHFTVSIALIQAPYVKLVVKPLAATATADATFNDIFVTELQTYYAVPASDVRGTTSVTSQNVNASLRHVLLRVPSVAYDATAQLTHAGGVDSYVLVNGLSYGQKLAPALNATARFARQDQGQPGQHIGSFQYSASLAATPLPTLSHSLIYSGQWLQATRGTSTTNSVTLFNRAEFYRGVNAVLSTGYSYNTTELGILQQGPNITASASVVPHPALTLSSTYLYTSLTQSGGGQPEATFENERVDGNVSFSPFPALYLAAGVSRIIKGQTPTTLANLGANFSPFPDGDLLLRSSYTETLDTASQTRSRVASAGAHWAVRPGAFLDLSYTYLDTSAPTARTTSRVLQATFVLQL